MARFNIGRQTLFCLMVMIVAATTRAQVLPLPTARNDTVSSGQPGDLPTARNDTVSSGQPGDQPTARNDTVTSGQPGDLPTAWNDTVSSGQPGDQPAANSSTTPRIEDDSNEDESLTSDLASLIAAVNEEANNIVNKVNDFWKEKEEIMKKILKHREEIMTDVMKAALAKLMQDAADYNSKMKDFGDMNDTIRNQCGEDVLSAVETVSDNFEDKEGVVTVLTVVALLQLHGCPSAATNITTRLLEAVEKELPETVGDLTQGQENENDTITQKRDNEDGLSTDTQQVQNNSRSDGLDVESQASHATISEDQDEQNRSDAFPLVSSFDHCDHVADCQRTGIPAVRQQLAGHPSLRAEYDVVVAAVFAFTHSENVSKPLLDDVIAEFNVTSPDFNVTAELNVTSPDFNVTDQKRSSCEDATESKVHEAVGFVPFASGLYNFVSSAVYAGVGCTETATERGIEAAVDVAMDVATVYSGGTSTAATQGSKTALKTAGKSALNTAGKAVKTAGKALISYAQDMVTGDTVKDGLKWLFGKKRSVRGAMRVSENDVNHAANMAGVNRDRVKSFRRGTGGVFHNPAA